MSRLCTAVTIVRFLYGGHHCHVFVRRSPLSGLCAGVTIVRSLYGGHHCHVFVQGSPLSRLCTGVTTVTSLYGGHHCAFPRDGSPRLCDAFRLFSQSVIGSSPLPPGPSHSRTPSRYLSVAGEMLELPVFRTASPPPLPPALPSPLSDIPALLLISVKLGHR